MYARIVTRELDKANAEGTSRLVYIPMKAVVNIVREARCWVKCVVDARRG
jgi:hypothetical protein